MSNYSLSHFGRDAVGIAMQSTKQLLPMTSLAEDDAEEEMTNTIPEDHDMSVTRNTTSTGAEAATQRRDVRAATGNSTGEKETGSSVGAAEARSNSNGL
ncbi:unnamed protein product [Amoebophrya sp. A25]|nr:unnamed protein product [Amoebophrya sp. A25]|eukprot:GSA25T00000623001.1